MNKTYELTAITMETVQREARPDRALCLCGRLGVGWMSLQCFQALRAVSDIKRSDQRGSWKRLSATEINDIYVSFTEIFKSNLIL